MRRIGGEDASDPATAAAVTTEDRRERRGVR
jgi:hypothetical protein